MDEDGDTTKSWSNLYQDGRRLERIIKLCETNALNDKLDTELKLAYIDRLVKTTHEKVEILKVVTAVDKLLKRKEVYA